MQLSPIMNDSVLLPLVASIIALAVGVWIGWLLGRKGAGGDAGVAEELRGQVASLRADVEAAASRRIESEKKAAAAEAKAEAAEQRVEELRSEQQKQLATLQAEHERSIAQMRDAFAALSSEALSKMQPQFLALANEAMAKHAEGAKGDLSKRQEAISAMLKPVEELLRTHQERLAQSETTQASALGEVKKHLETLAQNSASLSGETLQLRRVLGSSSSRGRWGEETLRRCCEASGMSVHCDFQEQAQVNDSKPDLVVKLPGNRVIIVDSKVPDFEFLAALQQSDDTMRKEALRLHAEKLKATIKDLAARDYPSQFPNALDYIVLFLPAESLFSAALEGDSELIVWAQQRRIMLATPTTLIALLRSVSVSWQQHDQAENAREIAGAAEELYSRVATFVRHFDSIRGGLAKATEAFNDAVGSYERSVRPQGERVLKLGAGNAGKQLADTQPISDSLRLAPAAAIPPPKA